MNPFDSKFAASEYKRLASEMGRSERAEFARAIQALYWEKQLSEQGEFDSFLVSVDDVRALASNLCLA